MNLLSVKKYVEFCKLQYIGENKRPQSFLKSYICINKYCGKFS